MSISNKTLEAIEEKRKWELREKELNQRLRSIDLEKKSCLERIKTLKDEINACENSIFTMTKGSRDMPRQAQRMDDIIR